MAVGKKYDQGIVDDLTPAMINTIIALDVKETFLWGADYFAELLPNKNDGSWVVWDKRANGNDNIEEDYSSDKMYGSCFELCWSRNKHKRDIARVKWASVFGTEQEFDHKRHHPTKKPVKLSEWFSRLYAPYRRPYPLRASCKTRRQVSDRKRTADTKKISASSTT